MKKFLRLFVLLLALSLTVPSALAASSFYASDARDAKLKALECLRNSAFGSEYNSSTDRLVRWDSPIRIYVGGNPTQQDMNTLRSFIMELNLRVPELPNITLVNREADSNVQYFFVPLRQMGNYVSNYTEGNWGYVSYRYQNYRIYTARIAIAADATNQRQRNHLIMEEFVGGLGMGNDHYLYSDSIIYQPWTEVQAPSEVDWLMLNMVYSPHVQPGMSYTQVYNALQPRIIRQ